MALIDVGNGYIDQSGNWLPYEPSVSGDPSLATSAYGMPIQGRNPYSSQYVDFGGQTQSLVSQPSGGEYGGLAYSSPTQADRFKGYLDFAVRPEVFQDPNFRVDPYLQGLNFTGGQGDYQLANTALQRMYDERGPSAFHPDEGWAWSPDRQYDPEGYMSLGARHSRRPGYDGPSTFDKWMRTGTLATLAAIGGGAAGLYGGAGAAAGEGAAAGAGGAGAGAGATAAEGAGFTGGFTGTAAGSPGFAGAAAGSPGLAATTGATGTSLAPGFFAGESLYPVAGGLTGAAGATGMGKALSGANTAATGAGAGTALSRILDGTATAADYLSLAGGIAPALLGAYASNKQSQSFEDLANRYMDMGAPSRARYEGSFAPGFSMENDPGYTDALNQTTKSTLHGMSAKFGNPADSPNAWTQTLKDVNASFAYPAMMDYRKLNANAGGLSRFAEAAPGAASNAITAQKGVYDAIGAGAADIFNPPRRVTFQDLMRMYA